MPTIFLANGVRQAIWKGQAASNFTQVIGETIGNRVKEFAIVVVFGENTTAGQVVIEASHDEAFTGTWDILGKANWLEANRAHHIAVTGVHLALRLRVASAVVGGTCDVYAGGI